MDKNEWKKLIKSYASKIGSVAIDLDYLSESDFVIGYGYDETEKKWKVYQNGERGMHMGGDYWFGSEEEALECLYDIVLDYHRYAEEDKEFRRKKAMKKAMEENQK